jgi:IS30 family transposase
MMFADNHERKDSTMNHYHHLSTNERESILFMSGQGKSIRAMAKALGRSAATISRELRRNRFKGGYFPSKADKEYRKRRKRCHRQKILKDPAANALVKRLFLEHQWSPEEISERLKFEQNEVQASTTTIYRAIYSGLFGKVRRPHGKGGICRHLRHRGKKRHRKGKEEKRGKIKISHHLSERPEEANNRSELGHLEADTVAGKASKSCIITLTDRKSRFLWVKRVAKRTAALVKQGLIELLKEIPPDKLHTITPDRGKEFASHEEVTEELQVPFYFPNPHSPWERGTNENTNGLIREYCPKSVDMDGFDDAYFVSFVDKLNRRPRKCLGWKSPYEVFYGKVLHLT